MLLYARLIKSNPYSFYDCHSLGDFKKMYWIPGQEIPGQARNDIKGEGMTLRKGNDRKGKGITEKEREWQ